MKLQTCKKHYEYRSGYKNMNIDYIMKCNTHNVGKIIKAEAGA